MRLNQYVAAATGLSRRTADAAISGGRVSVNDQPAKLGQVVGAGDAVELDGNRLVPAQTHTYVMLHKPVGYVSSRRQQGDDPTLYELLPPEHFELRIVGRLDRDSSGLVLLTNDGDFIQRYTHPSYEKTKRYRLVLPRPLTTADQARLTGGVELSDGPSHIDIESVKGRTVVVSMHEGRNRQLRRTFGALGYAVESLVREAMGPYELGGLASGKWRRLTEMGRV